MRSNKKLHEAVSRSNRGLARLWHDRNGTAAVELALVSLFLASIVVGVVDYGTAWNHRMGLENAVRAGNQYALIRRPVDGDTSQIRQSVVDALPPPPADPLTRDIQVLEACACPGNAPGTVNCTTGTCAPEAMEKYVTISIQEDFEMMFDWPAMSNPLRLSADGFVRLE